jgi:DNA polymerase (family X)
LLIHVVAIEEGGAMGERGGFQTNIVVADLLRQYAGALEQQRASSFRVNAFRRAAQTVETLDDDLRERFAHEGYEGLLALPAVGSGIAAAMREILLSGRWTRLEQIRGTLDPVKLFQTVATIGPALARRIHDALQVETLEDLELAAHDGRLATVPGMGERRAAAVRGALSVMLGHRRLRLRSTRDGPPVALLLEVDREYRENAAAGNLTRIAPRRFNPEGEAWLPVFHCERDGWNFSALFSNTARAHQLGRTHDWVVIFFDDGGDREGQHTVVTETVGRLQGRRVVRGREPECFAFYADEFAPPPPAAMGSESHASL